MRCHSFPRSCGFTLVEAIIVIAITGIIAAMVAVFIRTPVQGYFDSAARAELTDVGDTALRRMARDLRLALPNSIRVSGTYIELLLTSDGGRYLAEEDNPAAGRNLLDFNNGALQFDVVGPVAIASNNSIVVYNLGPDMEPANAYCPSNTGCNNRAVVRSVATDSNGITTVNLFANPFPGSGALRSPNHRFQVVTMPVTYACVGNKLLRYAGYSIQQAQPTNVNAAPLSSMTPAVLASGVTACNFSYTNMANNMRNGLIGLEISITGTGNAGTVQLFHQVHVDNTP